MRLAALIVLLWASAADAARFAIAQPDGRVVTVVEAPGAASVIVEPGQQVVEVPPGAPASTGATYAGGTFTPPPVPTSTLIERKLDAHMVQTGVMIQKLEQRIEMIERRLGQFKGKFE